MRIGEPVFVDTSAWIALALAADPFHAAAVEVWRQLEAQGARLRSSIPIVLETYTFLERNYGVATAQAWRDSLRGLPRFSTLPVTNADLAAAWPWLERRDLHKLSAVDATSFAVMRRLKIRRAFAFDHHFASAGFQVLG
mgnify:CR=1 FL=1